MNSAELQQGALFDPQTIEPPPHRETIAEQKQRVREEWVAIRKNVEEYIIRQQPTFDEFDR